LWEQHRQPRFGDDAFEFGVQQVAGDRVEGAERFVHQQDIGILRQCARERYALTHPARQLMRSSSGEGAQPHDVEQFGHSGPPFAPGNLAGSQRQVDVSGGRQPRE
jgi:hypothetical protein